MRNVFRVSPASVMKSVRWGVLLSSLLVMTSAQAFVLGRTRIIMPEGSPVSLPVISGSKDGLLLVQARSARDADGKIRAPELMVSPPVFRLEKGGQAMLRLLMVPTADFPRDRETVRYLLVTGIPSSNPLSPERGKIQSGMVVGQGAIIKVFWRPRGLKDTTSSTWKSLQAVRVPGGVQLINPTPYYMSFSGLFVDKKPVILGKPQSSMLAPFSRQIVGTTSVTKKEVEWTVTTDLGGHLSGKTAIH